jgi:hypothetical protein
MARKSILEGGARQTYSSCLADGCENNASKMTSFSGLGELRVVPKPKDEKPAPKSREAYDPHTIHFAPLCSEHARQADSRGARSTNLTKKVAETWRQGEANISALKPADVPLNPRKKKPRMTFMSGQATGTADPIQEYINYGVKTAKTKKEKEKFSGMSHERAVSSRRSKKWKAVALDDALKIHREHRDPEKEGLLEAHLSAIKEDNAKYLKDTGTTTDKGNWNQRSSEENPFFASHMRRTSRDYYFRPSKDADRKIVPHKPPKPKYISTRAKSAGPEMSGDILLTGRQAAVEKSLQPRLENIEKEYQQKKQARLAGKQFNQPAKVIITPGN